jgi:hypothetical protein
MGVLLGSSEQQAGAVALPSSGRAVEESARMVAEQSKAELFTGNSTGSWGQNGQPTGGNICE